MVVERQYRRDRVRFERFGWGAERQFWKVKDSLVVHRCVADWQSRLGKSRNVGALIGLHGQSRTGR